MGDFEARREGAIAAMTFVADELDAQASAMLKRAQTDMMTTRAEFMREMATVLRYNAQTVGDKVAPMAVECTDAREADRERAAAARALREAAEDAARALDCASYLWLDDRAKRAERAVQGRAD